MGRGKNEHFADNESWPGNIVWQACLQLGRCDEIAEYSTTSKDDILRALREGGNLESYVERRPEVGRF